MVQNKSQHLCLFVYDKQSNDLAQLEQINIFYPKNQQSIVCQSDYWFVLHSNGNIIAECAVYLNFCSWKWVSQWFCRKNKRQEYTITDVLVYGPYRGNGYCSLLLLNVMNWFVDQYMENDLIFSLWTDTSNRSARKAYQKIFGYKGDRINPRLIYFTTKNNLK